MKKKSRPDPFYLAMNSSNLLVKNQPCKHIRIAYKFFILRIKFKTVVSNL